MRINEIFYSIQGEGYWTGTPSVFVRFSGCNQRCPFCDTRHETGTEMAVSEIVEEVTSYPCSHVVLTGGEPCLQLTRELLFSLRNAGCYVQVETNGSIPIGNLSYSVDWVTVSKKGLPIRIERLDEVKRVMAHEPPILDERERTSRHFFIQPMDTGDKEENAAITNEVVNYIKEDTRWRLSLQTQKILNVR